MKMTGVYHTERDMKADLRRRIKRSLKSRISQSARDIARETGVPRDSITRDGNMAWVADAGCSLGQLVRIALALDIRITIDNGKGTK